VLAPRPDPSSLFAKRIVPYQPTNKEVTLRAKIVHALERMQVGYSWCAFVPEYLGQSEAVNSAALAFIKACEYSSPSPQHMALESGVQHYGLALKELRSLMDDPSKRHSDESILTIALLGLFDSMTCTVRNSYEAHWAGIAALLLARPRDMPASQLARSVLYAMGPMNFRVGLQSASAFEDKLWLDLDFASKQPLSDGSPQLRRVSNQLFLRVPRLVALMRTLGLAAQSSEAAWSLAEELMAVEDKDAEALLLHRVQVKPTTDSTDKTFIPFSFRYPSVADLWAAIFYWEARLLILKLWIVLHKLKYSEGDCETKVGAARAEQLRAVTNIMMSWQYVAEMGIFTMSGIAQVFAISLWGAFSDLTTFRGVPVATVKAWIVKRLRESSTWKVPEGIEQMLDMKAATYAGGSLV
jgi:hypothetical protein